MVSISVVFSVCAQAMHGGEHNMSSGRTKATPTTHQLAGLGGATHGGAVHLNLHNLAWFKRTHGTRAST